MGFRTFAVLILASSVAAVPSVAQNQNPYGDDSPAANQPAPPANQPEQSPPAPVPQPQSPSQAAPGQPNAAVPATLTLPSGAIISVRTSQWLSSDRNHAGDTFTATLDQPLVVRGWVVARRGQTVLGRVAVAQKASENSGVSKLGLEITELTLVDGEQVPVSTEMRQAAPAPSVPGSTERNVATVGTTTVLGTILGAAIGGGQGAAIGAGLGATAGVAAVLYTHGRPTTVAPEALLSFRLAAPVEIATEKGALAFRPVSQGDYRDQDAYANAPRLRRPGYSAPYYYYGYCGPWGWGCYPGAYYGPYVGIGGWGYGPPYRFGRW
jgi:hypothetical protein